MSNFLSIFENYSIKSIISSLYIIIIFFFLIGMICLFFAQKKDLQKTFWFLNKLSNDNQKIYLFLFKYESGLNQQKQFFLFEKKKKADIFFIFLNSKILLSKKIKKKKDVYKLFFLQNF